VNSKLIIIQNQHDKDIIEARKSLYVIQDPFLPSRLYGAIAELFQYKLMASQLDSKVEMNSDVKLIGQVLIVEDNLTNQLIASELLKSTGLVIHKASNGQEAIELVKKNVYQLILMDLHMPVMDGFEATRQIREQSSTPIIAITADALEGIQERCLEVGMNDFISKPFIPNEFTTKVSMYIESTKQINHDEALMRVSNNKDLLRRIQSAFIEENESIIDQIDALLIERNYSELIEVFHKLKNDAGNIGASLIRQHIVEIEKHLKSHDYQIISNHYKIFKSQFETLLSELKETT
jgi:CheY-like chemotaxis protein